MVSARVRGDAASPSSLLAVANNGAMLVRVGALTFGGAEEFLTAFQTLQPKPAVK